ncbi:flagellar motor protein MotD [Niveibacterium terrae]|uniref:flagellar motor protein MotD n=1 Tax=Niveibacterium terrae TaxID=3373598 RepID=UPI003A92ACC4
MSRRKKEDEHENLERWMVSYADFLTLMFAFFVVMYAISSVNEGKYRVLSNSLVSAFRSATNAEGMQIAPLTPINVPVPSVRPSSPAKADPRRAQTMQKMQNMADEVRRVLAPLVRDGKVTVNEGAFGISIEINASALFAPGEAVLGVNAQRALSAVGQVLSAGDFPIKVEGHTDTLPISNQLFASNWELSAVRASAVVRLFVQSGVAPQRLSAAGYADQRPVSDNRTAEGRSRNRRVAILIESMLPPLDSEPQAGASSSR